MSLKPIDNPAANYSSNWYSYGLDKLIININKLEKTFGKKTITVYDILKYVVTNPESGGNPRYLIDEINKTKDYVDRIRKFIAKGIWVNNNCVTLAKTTDTDLEELQDKIYDIDAMENGINFLVDDLYDAYFQYTDPDVEHPIVRFKEKYGASNFRKFVGTYNVEKDKENIKKMMEELKSYVKRLELVHRDINNLLHFNINPELLRLINVLKHKDVRSR